MRGTRAAVARAVAGSMVVAALATGCAGEKSGTDDAAPSAAASTSTSAQPRKPPTGTPAEKPADGAPAPTAAALAEIVLAQGDLAEFRIGDMPAQRAPAGSKATPSACQALENVRIGINDPKPSALVRRYATGTVGDHQGTGTGVELSAYTADGAKRIVADVREAVAACAGGYDGGALHFTKVTALRPFAVGEETVAYRLEGRGTQPTAYTLVREGSVLITFTSATTSGAAPDVPQPLVVQQFMKLQAANSRR
ncbi:hypothetical protein [Streptomyces sp. NPDC048338]|uniref:hypothetical protein n=1 Tax=Streptomyces sp. NPDC048338 TaxID=3365536 RepID=UPI003720324F